MHGIVRCHCWKTEVTQHLPTTLGAGGCTWAPGNLPQCCHPWFPCSLAPQVPVWLQAELTGVHCCHYLPACCHSYQGFSGVSFKVLAHWWIYMYYIEALGGYSSFVSARIWLWARQQVARPVMVEYQCVRRRRHLEQPCLLPWDALPADLQICRRKSTGVSACFKGNLLQTENFI